MLDAIPGIERYLTTRADFDADERTQAWMVSRRLIVGEACRHVSESLRARHADVP